MTIPDYSELMPYSVVMQGRPGGNPEIVAGTAHARGGNITRIAIPKGVTQVQLDTAYTGATTLVVGDGDRVRDVQWWPSDPGGINLVEATTDGAYVYLRAVDATETDLFSLVFIPMPAQDN